jgi:hypothetical protein
MKKNIIILCASVMLVSMLTSCVKKIDALMDTSNTATVTFVKSGPKFLTEDATVNPKDSIQFNFTITSPSNMKYISIVKNGITSNVTLDTIKPNGNHHYFTAIKKLVADSIPGSYYFKVVARDTLGIYLGSSDPIVVTVTPDFYYYTNKRLYVPDTTAKTNKTYYNLTSQTAFSYSDITAATSNQIDIGYFFDPAILSGTTLKGHTIYNLALSPLPSAISMYDISTFTKNATQMKLITTPTWANLNSGGILKAQGVAAFKTASANSINSLAAGSVILFKTVGGKYGAIQVTYTGGGSPSKSTYINFEVKIQK